MDPLAHRFEQFEADSGAFDLRIDGVPIWERIRHPVFQRIRQANGFDRAHHDGEDGWKTYAKIGRLCARNLVFRNPFFAAERDIAFVGHPRRKQESDGTWWDIYCDPIHEATDFDSVHFEADHRFSHRTPAKTPNLRYLDLVEYGSTIQRKLGRYDVPLTSADRSRLEELGREIDSRFDATVDLVNRTEYVLEDRRAKRGLYRRILERVDPDLLVVVVSYGKETLIEVCQSLDIPVAELQHGIIHPYHFGYSFRGERTKTTFPDYLLTFGEFWTRDVPLPIPDHRVVPVGYPYLEQRVSAYQDVERQQQILFISQGTVGESLSKFAVRVAEDSRIDHDVVYKLHPGEYGRWRDLYPWLVDADVDVVEGDNPPLYELFAGSVAQVGFNSTALFEGLAFDLSTYIYDCAPVPEMQSLINGGAMQSVESVTELHVSISDDNTSSIGTEDLFTSGSLANVRRNMEAIQSNETGRNK